MTNLDSRKGWGLKNWCLQTMVLEKTLDTSQDYKEIKPVNPKQNQPWIFIGRADAEAEAPIFWPLDAESTYWKRPWCWERLRAEGEGGDRGWDGWMASPIQWAWIWVSSGRWWRTGKPSVVQSMGSQRVGHDLATERQQRSLIYLWVFAW